MLRLLSFAWPRPLFTRPERWYHLLWLPLVYPVAGWILMGTAYFTRLDVFLVGTLTMLAIHAVDLLILTLLVKRIIHHYTSIQRAEWRNWTALGVNSLLSAAMSVNTTWICSQVPLLGTQFTLPVALQMAGVGVISALLMGYVVIISDMYGRWQQNQIEKEQLRQAALRQQLDTLKSQINPHFLFNSLNSISALIAEEPQQAEAFVDKMAQVYRYLLQAHTRTWVSLEEETCFAQAYAHLLMIRYGKALLIQLDLPPNDGQWGLPPLTFQYLLDDILQNQVVQINKPLHIQILALTDGQLQVHYNHQPRTLRVKGQQAGFKYLVDRYELLGLTPPCREVNPDAERIILPLVAHPSSALPSNPGLIVFSQPSAGR